MVGADAADAGPVLAAAGRGDSATARQQRRGSPSPRRGRVRFLAAAGSTSKSRLLRGQAAIRWAPRPHAAGAASSASLHSSTSPPAWADVQQRPRHAPAPPDLQPGPRPLDPLLPPPPCALLRVPATQSQEEFDEHWRWRSQPPTRPGTCSSPRRARMRGRQRRWQRHWPRRAIFDLVPPSVSQSVSATALSRCPPREGVSR